MAEVVTVQPVDYGELSLFLSNFPDETRSQSAWLDRFYLWWDKNPSFSEDIRRGWVLREGNKIVGFLGNIPSYLQLFGKKERVFSATSWMVLPEYRNQSMALFFEQINACKDSILFDTSPTESVAKILRSLGFKLTPGCENESSVMIINCRAVLRAMFGNNFIGKILAETLGPVLGIIQSIRLNHLKKEKPSSIKKVTQADDSFENLWERTRYFYTNTNLRARDTIQWSYFDNTYAENLVFGYYRDSSLFGYVVLQKQKLKGLRILQCFDLWFDMEEPDIIESFVNFVRQYAQDNLFYAVMFPHFTKKIGNYFQKSGLLKVKFREKQNYFKVNPDIGAKIREEDSYFVGLQGDRGL